MRETFAINSHKISNMSKFIELAKRIPSFLESHFNIWNILFCASIEWRLETYDEKNSLHRILCVRCDQIDHCHRHKNIPNSIIIWVSSTFFCFKFIHSTVQYIILWHRPFAGWLANKRITNCTAFECIQKSWCSIFIAIEFNNRRKRAFDQPRSE